MRGRRFAILGALMAALAVGVGAFGAHGLQSESFEKKFGGPEQQAEKIATFETGVRYHMYHALGLFAVAWVGSRSRGRLADAAGWLMLVGTVLFSGSIYGLVLAPQKWMGPVTPIGGSLLMLAWILLAAAALRMRSNRIADE